MDYQKLRKWIRFYEKEGVSPDEAVVLMAFYVRNLVTLSFIGFDEDCAELASSKVDAK